MSESKLTLAKKQTGRPLQGVRVLITRSNDRGNSLPDMLERAGATVLEVPTIEIVSLEDFKGLDNALLHMSEYKWVVFGSARGVAAVLERLRSIGMDSTVFDGVKVATVGPSVAKALGEVGVNISLMPASYHSEALVEAFSWEGIEGQRVLVTAADIGGRTIEDGLASLGAVVDRVAAYRTVVPAGSREMVYDAFVKGIDIVTFTSPSTVRNLLSLLEGRLECLTSVRIACIGPATSSAALEVAGLKVHIVAKEHTLQGLVNSIVDFYNKEHN